MQIPNIMEVKNEPQINADERGLPVSAFIGVMLAVTHRHVSRVAPLEDADTYCEAIRGYAIDWRDSRRGCALPRRDSGRSSAVNFNQSTG